jgi:hypothetical protein
MEILGAIISALLGAAGVFTSTGVIELVRKLVKQIRNPEGENELLEGRDADRRLFTYYNERWTEGASRAPKKPSSTPGVGLFYAALLVLCVFAISMGVVWTLTHMGGPLEATVNTTVAKAGGSILIVGGGLFAAFFAVAFMAFVAIRVFSGHFSR